MTFKVLLADDHAIVRQGAKQYLEDRGVAVVGEATNGREAIEMARRLAPDVVVMDVHMPELSGIEATRRIHAELDAVRILVLTAYDEPAYLHALIEAGADGYVLKTAELSELYRALLEIAAGKSALTGEQLRRAQQHVSENAALTDPLTEREREVLREAARGLTNKEIGRALFVSDRTVQGHLQNIYQKLGVTTRTEAVTKALGLKLLELGQEEN